MSRYLTVVLEYPSQADIPRIGFNSKPADLGEARIAALQFNDALAELMYFVENTDPELHQAAFKAGEHP